MGADSHVIAHMKNFLIHAFLIIPVVSTVTRADSCQFEYWQVVPETTRCDTYNLPDFELRVLPKDKSGPENIQRFCTQYEIKSKYKTEKTGYCYTGRGSPSGPIFSVGPQKFVANFNFEGCRGHQAVWGTVFHPAFGTAAAKNAPLIPREKVIHSGKYVMDCGAITNGACGGMAASEQ